MNRRQEGAFMPETAAVLQDGAHPMAHVLLVVMSLFVLLALGWAYVADLDEVTSGMGRVIPSGQVKVVQNLEGGILSELLAQEGQVVEKGAPLLRLSDTQSNSSLRENRTRLLTLLAKDARLQAEANGAQSFSVSKEVAQEQPSLATNEQALFNSRLQGMRNSMEMQEKAVEQKEQELVELRAAKEQTVRKLELARKEIGITEPMVKQGIMSELELLRLRREVAELEGVLQAQDLAIPRVVSALGEAKRKAREPANTYRTQALEELNQVRSERASLSETSPALEDRVTRTVVRSPVRGSVIRVRVNTIGQVVRPGVDLVEIMPLEESLLVEAKIRPADIAFLRPGLPTLVKFSAYDFSIYGGLRGTLEQISPDTITDENGDHFYQIQVRTERNQLGTQERSLPIIPGMVATVDIITGKKTVLDYLLKPILKAKANALRER